MGSAGTPRAATAAPAPGVTCSAPRQTPVKVRNLQGVSVWLFIVSHRGEMITGDARGKERAVTLHKSSRSSCNFSSVLFVVLGVAVECLSK